MKTLKCVLFLVCCLGIFGIGSAEKVSAQRRTDHPNARYNTQNRFNARYKFLTNELTVNAGNVFINELQITYGRAITDNRQLSVSAGWIRPALIRKTLKSPDFFYEPPYWAYCNGFSVATGYSVSRKRHEGYWNFQVFYRYMFYNDQEMYLYPDPSVASNGSEIITVEDLQRHVLGVKVLLVLPLCKASSFRCNFFAGVGGRVKFDSRHFDSHRRSYNTYRYDFDKIKKNFERDVTWMPSVHCGFQIGFGW